MKRHNLTHTVAVEKAMVKVFASNKGYPHALGDGEHQIFLALSGDGDPVLKACILAHLTVSSRYASLLRQ